jgi:mRNA-degrading endonuclease RelE of RelBE toxin-antitoxin system
MTCAFRVLATPHFERPYRKLEKQHPEVPRVYAKVLSILQIDPQNRTGRQSIKKLEGVKPGEGQYRIRAGRWRFRYDVFDQDVVLHYRGLRREETYT